MKAAGEKGYVAYRKHDKTLGRILSKNSACQERWDIFKTLKVGERNLSTNYSIPSKAVLLKRRRDNDFPEQTSEFITTAAAAVCK